MTELEGVIKYRLEYAEAPPLPAGEVGEIEAWRRILFRLRLIGQDPARYQGLGYGNLSRRLGAGERFLVTGTQTGGLAALGPEHYVTVTGCRPEENYLAAEGPIRPSSESLTHGILYRLDPQVRWVAHAHCPEIWRHARDLDLPCTRAEVPYGTPQMAAEVARLWRETAVRETRIFAMGGHEDGVVAFGGDAEEAGTVLVKYLARALQLSRN